jgi:hypothetical protein
MELATAKYQYNDLNPDVTILGSPFCTEQPVKSYMPLVTIFAVAL